VLIIRGHLDAFGEDDPQIAVNMVLEYVRMVRKCGRGVPVCIDSSNDNVLKAGLKEWFIRSRELSRPLVNSIKVYT